MIVVPRKTVPEVQSSALPNVTQRIDTPDGMFGDGGRGLAKAADAFEKLGANLDKQATSMLDEQNAARTLELTNMARKEAMDRLYNPESGILTKKGGNALGVQAEMEKTMADIKQKYGQMDGDNQDVKSMMAKSLSSLEESTVGLAQRHQFSEFQSYKTEQLAAVQTANVEDVALNFNDEKNFTAKWDENLKALTAQSVQEGWSTEQFGVKSKQLYSTMRAAQIDGILSQGNPSSVLVAHSVFKEAVEKNQLQDSALVRKYNNLFAEKAPKAAAELAYQGLKQTAKVTDKNDVISLVIDKMEGGGDSIYKDNNGAATKYGLNTGAAPNKDLDLENLTKDGAIEHYGKAYWDSWGIDDVPENMRLLAFDTVVNHGNMEFVKKAVEAMKKGVSYDTIMKAREQEYRRLAATGKPEYKNQLKGWINRLEKLDESYKGMDSISLDKVQQAAKGLDMEYEGAGEHLLDLYSSGTGLEKAQKAAQRREIEMRQLNNRSVILDIVNDQTMGVDQKLVTINREELLGNIDGEFATNARRLLNSAENIVEDPQAAADIIVSIHDLNASAEDDPEKYLTGVNNVRMNIAKAAAEGKIGSGMRVKLENQIKTLTSAKEAEATKYVSSNFKGAQKLFELGLPPEYHGQAVRAMFFETTDENGNIKAIGIDTKDNDALKKFYSAKAHEIIDQINKQRRDIAIKRVSELQSGVVQNEEQMYSFNSVEEADAADLPSGTIVYINGKRAQVE